MFLVSPFYFYFFLFFTACPTTRHPLPVTCYPPPVYLLPATRHPSPAEKSCRLTSDANDFVNAKSHAREQERKTSARRVEEGRPYNKKQENKTTVGSGYTRLNSGDVLLLLSLLCSSLDVTQCSPERGGALRDIQKTAETETSVAGAGLGSFLVIFFTER